MEDSGQKEKLEPKPEIRSRRVLIDKKDLNLTNFDKAGRRHNFSVFVIAQEGEEYTPWPATGPPEGDITNEKVPEGKVYVEITPKDEEDDISNFFKEVAQVTKEKEESAKRSRDREDWY